MFLDDRYKNLGYILSCDGGIPEPDIIKFTNADEACKLLDEHLYSDKDVLIHADVDFDGIGSAYEVMRYFKIRNPDKTVRMCINNVKNHGISKGLIKQANQMNNLGLLVIVDSSSNMVDLVKKIKSDVLVIDHHQMDVRENLVGSTENGKYVVINNVIDNDSDFSCGLVIYEFLRYYERERGLHGELDASKLYQWAVCTLYTDVINTDNPRNLYYVTKALEACSVEETLRKLLDGLCGYNNITKTSILFSLAPCVNAAIRAGFTGEALKIVTSEPYRVKELKQIREKQREMLKNITDLAVERGSWASLNLGDAGLPKSYTGLVASMLVDRFKKSSVVYVVKNGVAIGSFRGLRNDLNYRKITQGFGVSAEGHPTAFGFSIPLGMLPVVMDDVSSHDRDSMKEYCVYQGCNIPAVHTITDFEAFRKEGNIWKVSMINAKMAGGIGNLNIIVPRNSIKVVEEHEKWFEYDCAGLRCKAFEPILSENVVLYIEYNTDLVLYLRNKWDNLQEKES